METQLLGVREEVAEVTTGAGVEVMLRVVEGRGGDLVGFEVGILRLGVEEPGYRAVAGVTLRILGWGLCVVGLRKKCSGVG